MDTEVIELRQLSMLHAQDMGKLIAQMSSIVDGWIHDTPETHALWQALQDCLAKAHLAAGKAALTGNIEAMQAMQRALRPVLKACNVITRYCDSPYSR